MAYGLEILNIPASAQEIQDLLTQGGEHYSHMRIGSVSESLIFLIHCNMFNSWCGIDAGPAVKYHIIFMFHHLDGMKHKKNATHAHVYTRQFVF